MAKKSKKTEQRISNIPQKDKNVSKDGVLVYKEGMTVADMATGLGKTIAQVVMKLMQLGIMANQNQSVDRETVELVALDFGYELKDEVVTDATRFDEFTIEDKEDALMKRPPVVTIMGHVDHGKTTLLDYIRNSRVAAGEAGGITQHIGAYQVERKGEKITFIDTPGHAAFTEMRARGAQVTDIVVLVVAADDGVMPQTEEAISHAKAAKCPIIVAVNKCDKPSANPDRVMEELTHYDIIPEAWGGSTPFVQISALKGMGVDDLLDVIQLTAEMMDLKANPSRLATGSVIEAELDKGRGPVATFLVQNGSLRVGDYVVCGDTYGRVRTMEDDRHIKYNESLPSMAVVVTGLDDVPFAGDKFMALSSEKEAREISEQRTSRTKDKLNAASKKTLEELFRSKDDAKELNLIVKADLQGSAEALKQSLEKIKVDDFKVNVIRCSVGAITDTDIILASASNAIVLGFNVRPTAAVRQTAAEKGVEIRLYSIIYKLLEDIEAALKGMLEPEYEEVVIGQAEVRNTFKISKVGTVAGCYVTDGVIQSNSLVRIIRDGIVVYEGKMASLKRFKDDAKEVKYGYECGITIENFNDIKEGDIIEASVMKEIERK
ncbi:translation initiation factor IF-2 [Clostridium sp. CAG:307]|nr:MAG: translation initiation factor IF-2 [Clostridium sp. CAG:307_30_263]CDE25731.1 translation initiation factor IF-2 [Clostridium sp. CAG:307]